MLKITVHGSLNLPSGEDQPCTWSQSRWSRLEWAWLERKDHPMNCSARGPGEKVAGNTASFSLSKGSSFCGSEK